MKSEVGVLLPDIVAAAVLSGNRNFEGRVHPLTRANYLASPPLVVAYSLAGTVFILTSICHLLVPFPGKAANKVFSYYTLIQQ